MKRYYVSNKQQTSIVRYNILYCLIYLLCVAGHLLGSNAFKHTWTGGVTVRLFAEKREEREGVVLEVSDTGTSLIVTT